MELIKTNDGSLTFYNVEFDDIYHSKSGAKEEAMEKFGRPAFEYIKKTGKREVKILDICFGLGYNSCSIIDLIKENNYECNISITAIEKDIKIIEKIKDLSPNFKNYNLIKKAVSESVNEKDVCIKLLIKDAPDAIDSINALGVIGSIDSIKDFESIDEKYDIVFHDPFAPKKHPELWTNEFFCKVSSCMKKGGRLYTYSCAKSVRDALKSAGFSIENGPKVGRRAPSTIAIL